MSVDGPCGVMAQCRFTDEGDVEVDDEIDTTLEHWGVDAPGRVRETRYEVERASTFGLDDRGLEATSASEQSELVLVGEDGQVGLDGEEIGTTSLW